MKVTVGVGTGVGRGTTEGAGLGVGVIGVGAGVTTGVGAGVGSTGFKTGFRFGLGAALIATPLFQTSLLPDLMQVNFFPEAVAVMPALVHLAPAFTDAKDGAATSERVRITESKTRNFLRTE
jgi:hypothetical protein